MRREMIGIVLLSVLLFSACQQKMARSGRVRDYEGNSFFPDGSSARHPVDGTVAREQFNADKIFTTGKKSGTFVQEIPVPITRQLLERGRERFNIYCAPCHGIVGDGQGMIVKRGFTAPPSYHTDRLRAAAAGHYFDVITRGYGAMFSYADRVAAADRWAIIAYIRALQKSQHARYDELPEPLRRRIDQEEGK